jgi:uncharacterized protein (DUF1919 family)
MNVFITNCCLGSNLHRVFHNDIYNNPFIGTLIPDDNNFLKLCENFLHYVQCEPICDILPSNDTIYSKQTNGKWYNNPEIRKPYPIIHLEDIEIHCIHESDLNETLQKFKRRLDRLREIIQKNDYKIYMAMTFTNFFTVHENDDYKPYINRFLSNNDKNKNIFFLFVGPQDYVNHDLYVHVDYYNLNIKRRIDNVNVEIDFDKDADTILNFFKKKFV